MPAITALERDFAEKGLAVLAVAVDRGNPKAVQKFIQQYSIGFDVPLDPDGSVRKDYEIEALPTSYLIGKDGRFITRAVGDRPWNSSGFRSLIEALLAGKNMSDTE
jgi:peroxiredoxin